ncbi:DUF3231 family protein [Ammoniphilus resinae]|uniref:DUF3231 family protein n=1 Tax=Ammoniphilus resinae TaxID=861532 RepID=A0ABS4GVE2_9BACL|nr:DUF3231 family protein [Ammoniphilus resinae]MBP1934238.1 hypothetical protein [Ammoniphilus resinae]
MKPINISSNKTNTVENLTSAEMGKLWATYMGNSMAIRILNYYLQHVEDEDIKTLLENALELSQEFMKTIEEIFTKESFPIPHGFSDEDVNLSAPRLFQDEFYVHYLKYTAKAGLSIYSVGLPLLFRKDVKDFFRYCIDSTLDLMEQIKEILMGKGLIIKPPLIPIPDKVEYVQHDFLNGFFGHVRPMHALEITHLYDNIENNVTSKALIMAFAQVAQDKKVRELFERGRDMTTTNVENYMQKLYDENLPAPTFLDDLVTSSTISPFSDKIMLYHKMDMFSMKIRAFGNSVAVNGRRDIGILYTQSLTKIAAYVEDIQKTIIKRGWLEQPPYAADRGKLASDQ